MTKTSFISKKSEKLEQKKRYYDSYLVLLRYDLKHKRDNSNLDKKTLEQIDEKKIENKKKVFENKLKKRSERIKKNDSDDKKRIWEIDFVRAVIIIGMLIDHFIGDFWMVTSPFGITHANAFFSNMYSFSMAYWDNPIRVAIRLLGVMLLLVLSGISASFSRNSIKRSLVILAAGGLMSLVFGISSIVIKDFTFNVVIGAITCIGLCLFIYSLTKLIFQTCHIKKYFKWFSLVMALGIFIMWGFLSYFNPDRSQSPAFDNFWYIFNDYVSYKQHIYTPDALKENLWKVIIGLNYFGADWLPLFPYLGYMFLGGFIGETVYKDKKSLLRFIKSNDEISVNEKFNFHTRWVNFAGKHSIWFYLLHQPVFILIILIIALITGAQIKI